ncbi:YpmS family protein [Enterococcus saccharolyticus]|nr:YpmS family protein [Enterococcus saccharolyticus]
MAVEGGEVMFQKIKQFGKHSIQTIVYGNKWKIAFFALIAIVLGSSIFLFSRITEKRELVYHEVPPLVDRAGSPVLNINSNKEQINALIGFYLDEYQKNADITFDFALENEALLTGEFKILGFPVTFYLYFDPYVMDNGNVQLKAKSLSIGTLGVPISEVMKMIQRNATLPDWIEIEPKEETVMIRLDQFRMQNGLFLKAEKINLVEDDIQVSLYLPEKNEE